jgi:thiamine biosynthesis lipoprotein
MDAFQLVDVMGTVFSVDVRDPAPRGSVIDEIIRWWHWVDHAFSPFRADSEISRLNRAELTPGDCTAQVAAVLSLCREAERVTDGYFDAYTTGRLDPCGLVKGWSIEIASTVLAEAGSANHCINGGGDVRCAGEPEPGRRWRVGITDPLRPNHLVATAVIGDGAVATSGSAERGHHIVNPRTGRPVTTLSSVTVVGPDLTWADAYATAAFAMGEQASGWLCNLDKYEGLIIAADGARRHTPGFPSGQ